MFSSLQDVINLAGLIMLLFLIFSVLGMEMFGLIECSEKFPCKGLGVHANFQNAAMSALTLFRISTSDNWSPILDDCLRTPPLCDNGSSCTENCCAYEWATPIFFAAFLLLSQFLMLKIVVAVLMKNLTDTITEADS